MRTYMENGRLQRSEDFCTSVANGNAEVDLNVMSDVEVVIHLLQSNARSLKCQMCCVDPNPLVCVRLALALANNIDLVSLEILGCSDLVAVIVVQAVKSNRVLETLLIQIQGGHIGLQFDDVCFAMPNAFQNNTSLKTFDFAATSNLINDDIGCVLAKALRSSSTLQSFRMDTRDNTIGDSAGLAIANVLRTNVILDAFEWDARGSNVGMQTQLAIDNALRVNVRITNFVFRHGPLFDDATVYNGRNWCERNSQLYNHWRSLALLACADNLGFGSLISSSYRSAVFAFLLPCFCSAAPRWFLKSGWSAP